MNKVALFTENNSSLVQESLRVSHPLIKWNWNQMSTVGLSVNPVATGLGKSYSAVLAIALHICAQVREFVNDGIPSLAWRFKTSYFSTPRKANRDEEMISLLKNLETLSSQGLISSYELQYVKGQIGILKSKADIVSDWFYDLKVDGTKAKIVFSSRKHKAFKHTVEEIFRAGSYECPTWKVLLSAIRDLKYLRRDCDVESLNAVHARMSEIVLRVSDNRKNNKFFNKKVYRALRDTSLFKDFFRETECCEGKLAAVFVTSQKAASRFKNLGPEGRYLDFGLLDDEQYLPTTASPHLYGALFMDESDQSHKALLDFSFNKYDEDNIISFDNVISLCSTLDQDVNAKLSGYKYYKKHIQKAAENARKIKEETWISRAIKTSPKLLEQAQSLNINIFGNRIGGAYAGIPDLWIGKKIGDDCEEDYLILGQGQEDLIALGCTDEQLLTDYLKKLEYDIYFKVLKYIDIASESLKEAFLDYCREYKISDPSRIYQSPLNHMFRYFAKSNLGFYRFILSKASMHRVMSGSRYEGKFGASIRMFKLEGSHYEAHLDNHMHIFFISDTKTPEQMIIDAASYRPVIMMSATALTTGFTHNYNMDQLETILGEDGLYHKMTLDSAREIFNADRHRDIWAAHTGGSVGITAQKFKLKDVNATSVWYDLLVRCLISVLDNVPLKDVELSSSGKDYLASRLDEILNRKTTSQSKDELEFILKTDGLLLSSVSDFLSQRGSDRHYAMLAMMARKYEGADRETSFADGSKIRGRAVQMAIRELAKMNNVEVAIDELYADVLNDEEAMKKVVVQTRLPNRKDPKFKVLLTTYSSAGAGFNLQLPLHNSELSSKTGMVRIGRTGKKVDIDYLYLDTPTSLFGVDLDLKTSLKLMYQTTCVQIALKAKLGEHSPIEWEAHREILDSIFDALARGSTPQEICRLYKELPVYNALVFKEVQQAVGRICRTALVRPNIKIAYHEDITGALQDARFSDVEEVFQTPELSVLLDDARRTDQPNDQDEALQCGQQTLKKASAGVAPISAINHKGKRAYDKIIGLLGRGRDEGDLAAQKEYFETIEEFTASDVLDAHNDYTFKYDPEQGPVCLSASPEGKYSFASDGDLNARVYDNTIFGFHLINQDEYVRSICENHDICCQISGDRMFYPQIANHVKGHVGARLIEAVLKEVSEDPDIVSPAMGKMFEQFDLVSSSGVALELKNYSAWTLSSSIKGSRPSRLNEYVGRAREAGLSTIVFINLTQGDEGIEADQGIVDGVTYHRFPGILKQDGALDYDAIKKIISICEQ